MVASLAEVARGDARGVARDRRVAADPRVTATRASDLPGGLTPTTTAACAPETGDARSGDRARRSRRSRRGGAGSPCGGRPPGVAIAPAPRDALRRGPSPPPPDSLPRSSTTAPTPNPDRWWTSPRLRDAKAPAPRVAFHAALDEPTPAETRAPWLPAAPPARRHHHDHPRKARENPRRAAAAGETTDDTAETRALVDEDENEPSASATVRKPSEGSPSPSTPTSTLPTFADARAVTASTADDADDADDDNARSYLRACVDTTAMTLRGGVRGRPCARTTSKPRVRRG